VKGEKDGKYSEKTNEEAGQAEVCSQAESLRFLR